MATTKKANAAPGASKQENEVITSQSKTMLPPSVHEFEDEGWGKDEKAVARFWDFAKNPTFIGFFTGEVKSITPKDGKPFEAYVLEDKNGDEHLIKAFSAIKTAAYTHGVCKVLKITKGEMVTLKNGNKFVPFTIKSKIA